VIKTFTETFYARLYWWSISQKKSIDCCRVVRVVRDASVSPEPVTNDNSGSLFESTFISFFANPRDSHVAHMQTLLLLC